MFSLSQDVSKHISAVDSVLDIGAGILNHTKDIILHNQCKLYTAVEPFEPYINMMPSHEKLVKVNEEGLAFLQKQLDNSYHVVICLDCLEHLEKDKAILLLKEMKRVGVFVYVFTTDLFQPQEDGEGWGKNNKEWQKHRCGFSKEELEELGFEVEQVLAPHKALIATLLESRDIS